jgi:hypothetical protein
MQSFFPFFFLLTIWVFLTDCLRPFFDSLSLSLWWSPISQTSVLWWVSVSHRSVKTRTRAPLEMYCPQRHTDTTNVHTYTRSCRITSSSWRNQSLTCGCESCRYLSLSPPHFTCYIAVDSPFFLYFNRFAKTNNFVFFFDYGSDDNRDFCSFLVCLFCLILFKLRRYE